MHYMMFLEHFLTKIGKYDINTTVGTYLASITTTQDILCKF